MWCPAWFTPTLSPLPRKSFTAFILCLVSVLISITTAAVSNLCSAPSTIASLPKLGIGPRHAKLHTQPQSALFTTLNRILFLPAQLTPCSSFTRMRQMKLGPLCYGNAALMPLTTAPAPTYVFFLWLVVSSTLDNSNGPSFAKRCMRFTKVSFVFRTSCASIVCAASSTPRSYFIALTRVTQ